MFTIYCITNNKTTKKYIGQTCYTAEDRFKEHKKNSKNCDTYLYRSMRFHGLDCFTVLVVEENIDTQELANEREIYWIAFLGTLAPNGYNETLGGDGFRKPHTDETKELISKALIGNQYRTGIPHSDETKKQVSDSMKRAYAEGRHRRTEGLKKGTKLGPMSEEEKLKRSEGVKRARQAKFWSTRKKEVLNEQTKPA
jgi:group I intron endonuclease